MYERRDSDSTLVVGGLLTPQWVVASPSQEGHPGPLVAVGTVVTHHHNDAVVVQASLLQSLGHIEDLNCME